MTMSDIRGLVSLVRSGGNPSSIIQQMARKDPRVNQAMSAIQGKSSQQLEQMVRNMCREIGTTPEDYMRSMGL